MTDPVQDYTRLGDLIRQRTGLALENNRHVDVARLGERLLEELNLPNLHSLITQLDAQPTGAPLWQAVVDAVAVGETYFFRNQAHFNALRFHVLPALVNQRRASGQKQLRLWSAGCASGEEPYSLAILLRELIPDIDTWYISILGTDIDMDRLGVARRGCYGRSAFRNETPPDVREAWFTPCEKGYQIGDAVRRMVIFNSLNLVEDTYPSIATGTMHLDIIVCRNVTIYFDTPTIQRVVNNFHQALMPEGWLIVGHSEPLAANYQNFIVRNFENAVFYQKQPLDIASLFVSPAPTLSEAPPTPLARSVPARLAARPPDRRTAHPAPPPASKLNFSIAEAALQRAKQAADREDWDEAQRCLAEAGQAEALLPQVQYLRALIEMHAGRPQNAITALQRAVAHSPHFALGHYWLGELYVTRGERRAAARHWRLAAQSIANLPSDQPVLFADDLTVEMLRGLLALRLGTLPASS